MTEANFILVHLALFTVKKNRLLKMHRFKSDVSLEIPSKLEEIITDVAKVSHINAILLRYFNPIETHPSAEIGEYLLGTSKLSTLYYADWVWITKRALCLRRLPNA
jgi:hypothetical protein